MGSKGSLSELILEPAVILVRFINNSDCVIENESSISHLEGSAEQKEGRSKERNIGEVIEVVKIWRDLHLNKHKMLRRRLNLQDAAREIGISKKSLDDYYCQLRLGELYNFDYVSNLREKMGVLRSYVKNYRPERQPIKSRHNNKHPKDLKIINYFDL